MYIYVYLTQNRIRAGGITESINAKYAGHELGSFRYNGETKIISKINNSEITVLIMFSCSLFIRHLVLHVVQRMLGTTERK